MVQRSSSPASTQLGLAEALAGGLGEGVRPRKDPGAGALDPEAPRRPSTETDGAREPEPEPTPLEPVGLLLGSFSGFDARTAVAAADAPGLVPDRLVSDVVRALAWGGNQRRGAARIELGGERYGGTRLVVEVDGDELWLSVDAPPGVDAEGLRGRLAERFARRGLVLREG